jgi:hypothetical protein
MQFCTSKTKSLTPLPWVETPTFHAENSCSPPVPHPFCRYNRCHSSSKTSPSTPPILSTRSHHRSPASPKKPQKLSLYLCRSCHGHGRRVTHHSNKGDPLRTPPSVGTLLESMMPSPPHYPNKNLDVGKAFETHQS